MTKKEKSDRDVQGVMDSPLIRHIVASVNPDMDKLRKAIRATLKETREVAEEEPDLGWEDNLDVGSVAEKLAMAEALGVTFKKLWPETHRGIGELLATAGRPKKPRKA